MLRFKVFGVLFLLAFVPRLLAASTDSPIIQVDGTTVSGTGITRGNQATVSLSTSFSDGAIFYSLDGSEPSTASTRYMGPFIIKSTTTIRAIAYSLDFSQSAVTDPFTVTIVPLVRLTLGGPSGPGHLEFDPIFQTRDPDPEFPAGTSVKITEVPDSGWVFLQWDGSVMDTSNPVTILMDTPKIITPIIGTIVHVVPPSHGTIQTNPDISDPVPYDGTLILTGVPDNGYYFAAWGGDATGSSNTTILRVLAPNPSVSALFLPSPKVAIDDTFGFHGGEFGFTIIGSDMDLVVDASDDLTASSWSQIGTVTLAGGSVHFSDPNWANHSTRFYRIHSPFPPPPQPGLDYDYRSNNGQIVIVKYKGAGGTVSIPSSIDGLPVTVIGDSAFSTPFNSRVISSVIIPNTVTNIGSYSFANLTNITGLTIPSSVRTVGDYAFADWHVLTGVAIPKGIEKIGNGVFQDDFALTSIDVDALNPFYTSVGGILMNSNQTVLVQYPGGRAGAYSVPGTVQEINPNAFLGANNLVSLSIPSSVTNLADWQFDGCVNLTNVVLSTGLIGIGEAAFNECINLSQLVIPETVKSIGISAFGMCSNLTSVTLPNGITNLSAGLFYSCVSLASIEIPTSVVNIGNGAFYDCTSLEGIYFDGDAPVIGTSAFDLDSQATIYYRPGTSGWSSTFGGRPTAVWGP